MAFERELFNSANEREGIKENLNSSKIAFAEQIKNNGAFIREEIEKQSKKSKFRLFLERITNIF